MTVAEVLSVRTTAESGASVQKTTEVAALGEVRVLYRDPHLLAVAKPSGLLSVPGRGPEKQDCVFARLKHADPGVLIVHRLDQGTSGVLIFARDAEALRRLSWLFESRQVGKQYVALIRGRPADDFGTIDLPLCTDWERRPRQIVDHVSGKPAVTRYSLVEHDATTNIGRVKLAPQTGRTHQLRVHLASLGTPIVGDPLYGTEEERLAGLHSPPPADAPRLMLHAEELSLVHPFTGTPLVFTDPVPF